MSRAILLVDELMVALGRAVTQGHVDHLLHLGVPPAAVDMCGTAKIMPEGRHYVPVDGGATAEAAILPVFDTGIIIDLVAFDLASPAQWWLRRGEAVFIGGDALSDTVMDEPVRVFKTPLSWLRARAPADGLVVLDWDTARRELIYHNLIAEDIKHGLELDRLLTVPAQRPQIRVPAEMAA